MTYNIYQELNKITDYIEIHLLEEIKINELAKMIGLTPLMLKNIFVILTGISINEYIRYRRLSLACLDILKGESSTEVAMKYLYNSPSSFNHAFKNVQKISPTALKKNPQNMKLWPKITFTPQIESCLIEYTLIKNKTFNLFGLKQTIKEKQEIPLFWKKVKQKYPKFTQSTRFGFLKNKDYYCLLEIPFENAKPVNLSPTNYFVIKLNTFESQEIRASIYNCYHKYLKSLYMTHQNSPTIEIYYQDFVELYIPLT